MAIFGSQSETVSTHLDLNDQIHGSTGTPASNGTATKVSMYFNNRETARNVKCAVYTNSDNVHVATSEERAFTNEGGYGWEDFTISFSVVSGTEYLICAWSDEADGRIALHAETGEDRKRDTATYNGFPDPLVVDDSASNQQFSIYVEYTEAGAEDTQEEANDPGDMSLDSFSNYGNELYLDVSSYDTDLRLKTRDWEA